MYLSAAKIVKNSREQVYESVKDLTLEQWMLIPEGHDNNIAWNVGHLIWAQIGLTYGHSDLEMPISRESYIPLYGIGSSPADWASDPDPAELLKTFMAMPDRMIADATAGLFDQADFEPWQTGGGAQFNTLLDMMIYNAAHEGEHRGMIMALKNLVA
ncbi:MAG: hypothetical protein ACI85U_000942 [Candidatus Promineifilaceae bacterium]|jgi:hypothetical protein